MIGDVLVLKKYYPCGGEKLGLGSRGKNTQSI
jgi:hypothetical protein